ncbi:MAG: preprotein translocase subunit YajC [Propionibacteriaceae bacterium]|jgi:preprotein translocase subunit YajC|nr:preprotein translocase subunit YajC [Propionibacteriaceae bacterium]
MGGETWGTIFMVIAVGVAVYFMMIRPQKKQREAQKEAISKIGVGSRVMTIGGMIGTIVHMGEKQFILEVAPGIEITFVKQALNTQKVEDEFEYVDEGYEDSTPAEAVNTKDDDAADKDDSTYGEIAYEGDEPQDPDDFFKANPEK